MKHERLQRIETIGELFAHALELEHESTERYRELAQCMAVHHNAEIAALFERLALLSEEHARAVAGRIRAVRLPEIPPWEFKWRRNASPESDWMDQEVSYLMTAVQALTLALRAETRGRDFYAAVAVDSPDPEVRRAAAEMVEEESEHIALITGWLREEQPTDAAPPEDLDPPNTPG